MSIDNDDMNERAYDAMHGGMEKATPATIRLGKPHFRLHFMRGAFSNRPLWRVLPVPNERGNYDPPWVSTSGQAIQRIVQRAHLIR